MKNSSNDLQYNNKLKMPSDWTRFEKWGYIIPLLVIFKILMRISTDKLLDISTEDFSSFLNTISTLLLMTYLGFLKAYVSNFKKYNILFTITLILGWFLIFIDFISLTNTVAGSTDDIIETFEMIFGILYWIFIIITSRSLMKIKYDPIGGISTVSSIIYYFNVITIFSMLLLITVALLGELDESIFTIILNSIDFVFNIIIVFMISNLMRRAKLSIKNQSITNSNKDL